MALTDQLFWALAGGGLGASLACALSVFRRDLGLPPGTTAISTGLIALSAAAFSSGWEAVCLIAALSVLALTDLKLRIVPNELTYGLIAAGVAFALFGPRDPLSALLGAVIAAALLGALRVAWLRARGEEALGLGDVKMLAGIGAFIGPFALPGVIFWAAVAGIAMAFAISFRTPREVEIPFGAAMALSAWLYLAFGPILFAT